MHRVSRFTKKQLLLLYMYMYIHFDKFSLKNEYMSHGSFNRVWLNSLISLGSQKLQSHKFYKSGPTPLPPCNAHLAVMPRVDSLDAE